MTKTIASFKNIQRALKCSNVFRSSPYYWEPRRNRVGLFKGKSGSILWCLNFISTICYEIFVIARCIQYNYYEPNTPATFKIYMEYVCCSNMVPVVLHLNIAFNRQEWASCINRMLAIVEDALRTGEPPIFRGTVEHRSVKIGCEKFQKWFMGLGNLVVTLRLLGMWRHPERPALISSLMTHPSALTTFKKLPFFLFQVYHLCSMYSNLYIFAVPIYFLCFSGLNVLRLLSLAEDQHMASDLMAGRYQKLSLTYRGMQYFVKEMNAAVSVGLPGHKILFLLMIIRSIYAAIKMSGPSAVMMFFVALICSTWIGCTFNVLAEFRSNSIQVLQSWKTVQGSPEIRKFVRSCRHINIQVGSFYYVDKGLLLTLLSIVAINTINLLLSEA